MWHKHRAHNKPEQPASAHRLCTLRSTRLHQWWKWATCPASPRPLSPTAPYWTVVSFMGTKTDRMPTRLRFYSRTNVPRNTSAPRALKRAWGYSKWPRLSGNRKKHAQRYLWDNRLLRTAVLTAKGLLWIDQLAALVLHRHTRHRQIGQEDPQDAAHTTKPQNCKRIVVLGAPRVGKTSILRRYLRDGFVEEYKPTSEDFLRKLFRIRGETYQIDILDASKERDFPAKRRLSILTGAYTCALLSN